MLRSSLRYPPRLHGQTLQLRRRGPDEAPERDDTNRNAQHVDNVVAVLLNVTAAASVGAAVLLCLEDTGELLRDEIAFEGASVLDVGGREASRGREEVDELENEETRESAAEVGDAAKKFVSIVATI